MTSRWPCYRLSKIVHTVSSITLWIRRKKFHGRSIWIVGRDRISCFLFVQLNQFARIGLCSPWSLKREVRLFDLSIANTGWGDGRVGDSGIIFASEAGHCNRLRLQNSQMRWPARSSALAGSCKISFGDDLNLRRPVWPQSAWWNNFSKKRISLCRSIGADWIKVLVKSRHSVTASPDSPVL